MCGQVNYSVRFPIPGALLVYHLRGFMMEQQARAAVSL